MAKKKVAILFITHQEFQTLEELRGKKITRRSVNIDDVELKHLRKYAVDRIAIYQNRIKEIDLILNA